MIRTLFIFLAGCVLTYTSTVSSAQAELYDFFGTEVAVDAWFGAGSNETILVIDWNETGGPYASESHAFGYRWNGNEFLSDALAALDTHVPLTITTSSGGAFLSDIIYDDQTSDGDYHDSTSWSGWWWLGSSINGGQTWTPNSGGMDTEPLAHGVIEGMNIDSGNWTSDTLTIPVPEPRSFVLVGLASMLSFWARQRRTNR